jgi:hypothetical protein
MKFRMNEDLVRIYSGKPEITCTAVGTDNLTTARNTIVYEMEYHREEEMAATERVI